MNSFQNHNDNDEIIYLTIEDLKNRYRLGNRATVYKWINERDFPKQIKIGGKALWIKQEVEAYDKEQSLKRYA